MEIITTEFLGNRSIASKHIFTGSEIRIGDKSFKSKGMATAKRMKE
jgi:hypothetical protein